MNYKPVSRRRFLKSAGSLAAAASLPTWARTSYAQQDEQPTASQSANDRIQIGVVGCGPQGRGVGTWAERSGAKVVGICDVDAAHLALAQERFSDAQGYADFRELVQRDDIDAVVCGTVDHWHALVSMAAMKSGKDIYCEKPLTLTIDEGKRLVQVRNETNQILQTGSHQRSTEEFRTACDLVRNNRIGAIERVDVWLPAGLREGPFASTEIPEGFNYDFWLGQTPDLPYVKERTHFSFRYWWEYSDGTINDWGAHHNDIVQWALDTDHTGPVAIEARPLVDMIPGGYTAASEYEVTYTYANGVVLTCRSTTDCEWHGGAKNPDGQMHGIKFIGTDGWIWVTRGEITASSPEILSDPLSHNAPRVYHSDNHMENFLNCMRTRKAPICPVEVGHRTASLGHLGAIALHLGRKIAWDPERESIIDDAEAGGRLARPMRDAYNYDMI